MDLPAESLADVALTAEEAQQSYEAYTAASSRIVGPQRTVLVFQRAALEEVDAARVRVRARRGTASGYRGAQCSEQLTHLHRHVRHHVAHQREVPVSGPTPGV